MGEEKAVTVTLCRLIFKKEYLGNLEMVIKCVDDNLQIPYPKDYSKVAEAIDKDEVLNVEFKRPILSSKDQKLWRQRQTNIVRSIAFLKQWLGVVKEPKGEWWVSYMVEEGWIPFQADNPIES